MVSFWPWKSNDSSPASFEKALSSLSSKITDTQARIEHLRSTSRRVRALSTLYLAFAYVIYAIVLLLVVGWQNMGAWEWTGLAGGPMLIYGTRTTSAAFYNFRIDSLSSKLKDYQAERTKTIQKLKDATKYDSTLELLEKYGGPENKPSKKGKKGAGAEEEGGSQAGAKNSRQSIGAGTPGRTNLPPPPTANILRPDSRQPASKPGTPQPAGRKQPGIPPQQKGPADPMAPSAEFAPNAGWDGPPAATQYVGAADGEPRWYDRIMDLLLGEDETAPKNRIVLICKNCRLVNGQAPPGTKTLAELGQWRCMACGTMNGEIDEGKRIVREVLAQAPKQDKSTDAEAEASEVDNFEEASSDLVEVKQEDAPGGDDSGGVDITDKGEAEPSNVRRRRERGKK